MKRYLSIFFILAAFSCASPAYAYENPGSPKGFVNDFAGIFSPDQISGLEAKLSSFEKEIGAEISVVTIESLKGDTVANFAVKLMEDWGVGKKGEDNGILFLVAPNEREVRIEVGYGLEPIVTDAASSAILRTIVLPAFREEKYFEGTEAGVGKIMDIIRGDPEAVAFAENASSDGREIDWLSIIIIAIVVIIILSTPKGRKALPIIFWSGLGRGGMGGGRSGGFGGFGGGRSGGGGAGGKW